MRLPMTVFNQGRHLLLLIFVPAVRVGIRSPEPVVVKSEIFGFYLQTVMVCMVSTYK